MTDLTPQEAAWVATAIKMPPSSNKKIREIQLAVCALCNVTHVDMLSPNRFKKVVRARDIAIYRVRQATGKSLTEIARRFGNRHHTTIMASLQRVEARVAADPAFAAEIAHVLPHDHGATQ